MIIATLPQELNTESPPGGLYPAPVQGMQNKVDNSRVKLWTGVNEQ